MQFLEQSDDGSEFIICISFISKYKLDPKCNNVMLHGSHIDESLFAGKGIINAEYAI